MKILTNEQYKFLMDTVKELKQENKQLRRHLDYINCKILFCDKSHDDIDFPNSDHKVIDHVDKFI